MLLISILAMLGTIGRILCIAGSLVCGCDITIFLLLFIFLRTIKQGSKQHRRIHERSRQVDGPEVTVATRCISQRRKGVRSRPVDGSEVLTATRCTSQRRKEIAAGQGGVCPGNRIKNQNAIAVPQTQNKTRRNCCRALETNWKLLVGIEEVMKQRDVVKEEFDAVRDELDVVKDELGEARRQRDEVVDQREQEMSEMRELREAVEALAMERDEFRADVETLLQERVWFLGIVEGPLEAKKADGGL